MTLSESSVQKEAREWLREALVEFSGWWLVRVAGETACASLSSPRPPARNTASPLHITHAHTQLY